MSDEHREGVLYEHAKRPAWGVATFEGQAEGKLSFEFADGTHRSFAAGYGGMMVQAQAKPRPSPRLEAKPRARRPARSSSTSRRGSRTWTKAEDQQLRESSGTDAELGHALGRTVGSIRGRKKRIGLGRKAARWSEAEDRAIAGTAPLAVVAKELGRSLSSVTNRRQRLGVAREHRKWTAGDDAILEQGGTARELAAKLDRTVDAIKARRKACSGQS